MSWQKVRIGDFLKRRKETIEIKNLVEYRRITIKTKHQGVFLRDSIKGTLIGTKLQFTVKAGQFLLSKIDARLGAFGIVPNELDRAIITGNFWAFDVDKSKINIEWFNLFTSSGNFYEICNQASSGTTHRKYLDESKFLNFEIDLPGLDEQNQFIDTYESFYKNYKRLGGEIEVQQSNLQQLHQSILQEAVQGKLTQQNKDDEPADKLLERIKAEKQKLIASGKLKKEKELPPITEDEIPFELPRGWVWCRLGEISEFINGDRSKLYPNRHEYVREGIAWINTGHIEPDGSLSHTDMHFITRTKFDSLRSGKIAKGDLVYCLRGATIGKTAFVDQYKEGAIASSLMIIRLKKEISRWYSYYYLTGPLGKSEIKKFDNGSAQPNLSANNVGLFLFPLPPPSEQQRIATKVQQLLQMVNELEKQVEQSQTQAQQLLQAVLKEAFTNKEKAYEKNEEITLAAEK